MNLKNEESEKETRMRKKPQELTFGLLFGIGIFLGCVDSADMTLFYGSKAAAFLILIWAVITAVKNSDRWEGLS